MKETSKADERRFNDYLFKRIIKGRGIDIGSGEDLLGGSFRSQITCMPFDIIHGDAQNIHLKIKKKFDFCYSSNCLEHLPDPFQALKNWIKILKVGGYLIFTVPDEDLYEQGFFPSKFNPDHKHTFTLFKKKSWSPVSINIIELLMKLDNVSILRIQVVDTNYNYSIKRIDQTLGNSEAFIEVVLKKDQ